MLGAHRERRFLLEKQPHLTNWVPIAVPVRSWIQWPPPFGHPIFAIAPLVLPFIFKFYDSLSGFTCPPSHVMSKARATRKFPQLGTDVKYVQVFYEGQHNDARTNVAIALTAAEQGACVANHVEATGLIFDGDGAAGDGAAGDSAAGDGAAGASRGRATGVRCVDKTTGRALDVRAKAIVFAGGPFTDALRKFEDPKCAPAVKGAAGTHLVLPSYYLPPDIGMLDINTSDGRFLFFIPWQGSTLVGTTDRKGDVVSTPRAPEDEVAWIRVDVGDEAEAPSLLRSRGS